MTKPFFRVSSSTLRAAFSSAAALLRECEFVVDSSGVVLQGLDPANVALLRLAVPASSFLELSPGERAFSVRCEDWVKALRLAAKDSVCSFSVDDAGLVLVVASPALSREFRFPDLDLGDKGFRMPVLDKADVSVEIASELFGESFAFRSQSATLRAGEDSFTIYENSRDVAGAQTLVFAPDAARVVCSAPTKSIYGVEYLQKVTDAVKASGAVLVSLSYTKDYPLRVSAEGLFSLVAVLAPRVEDHV